VNATVASLVTRRFLRIRQRHWVFNTIPALLNALNESVTHQVHDGIGHSKVVRPYQRSNIYHQRALHILPQSDGGFRGDEQIGVAIIRLHLAEFLKQLTHPFERYPLPIAVRYSRQGTSLYSRFQPRDMVRDDGFSIVSLHTRVIKLRAGISATRKY